MIFNTTIPDKQFNVPKTTSNNPWLPVLGYNGDGTRNTWGDISSWIPGVNIAQNAFAQGATKGTDANANVQGDMKNRIDKLLAEAAIAATIATAGTAAPAIGAAVGGGAGAGALGGAGITASAIPTISGAGAAAAEAGGIGGATAAIGSTELGGQILKMGNQYLQGAGKQAGSNLLANGGKQQTNPYMPKQTDLTNYSY